MQVIGIDIGRNRVKGVSSIGRVDFPSVVGEWQQRNLATGGDYEITVDEKKVFIGDLAIRESYCQREMATETKIHQESKILFLAALALLAKDGEPMNVVTGLPVAQHTTTGKNKFKKLLEGTHSVVINGKRKNIIINDIGIVPEAGGAYWHTVLNEGGEVSNSFIARKKVRIVDVGSRTINFCTIDRREYIDRDSGTLPYGIIELMNADKASRDDIMNISEEAKEHFARRIAGDLSKKWLNYVPDNDLVLLTGGGSILLQQYLQQHFMVNNLIDTVYANAEGFFKMGIAKWGK
jgi:plasmid segregation protein ParM